MERLCKVDSECSGDDALAARRAMDFQPRESGSFPAWRSDLRFQRPAPGQGCGALLLLKSAAPSRERADRKRAGSQQEIAMAKRQKRSNREAKKPKAITPAADPNPFLMASGRLTPIKPAKKSR